jgi:hypothetical protein
VPVPAGGLDDPGVVPSWSPSLEDVAKYVPHRTLVRSPSSITDGEDDYLLTFDSTTRPTAVMVAKLIADGVAWVTSQVAPMHASSFAASATVAALFGAAHVERGWPNDDSSLERARDFDADPYRCHDGHRIQRRRDYARAGRRRRRLTGWVNCAPPSPISRPLEGWHAGTCGRV